MLCLLFLISKGHSTSKYCKVKYILKQLSGGVLKINCFEKFHEMCKEISTMAFFFSFFFQFQFIFPFKIQNAKFIVIKIVIWAMPLQCYKLYTINYKLYKVFLKRDGICRRSWKSCHQIPNAAGQSCLNFCLRMSLRNDA